MQGVMRKLPGAPELSGPGSNNILDALAIYRGRFMGRALTDPLRPFIYSRRHNWRGYVAPDTANQTIAARGTFEDQFSVTPGSFLLMISSLSDQPEGFRWLITDKGTKQTVTSEYGRHLAESGGLGSKFPTRPLPFILPSPWTVSKAGLVMVQITNLSAVANNINLFLTFAEPAA